MSAPKRTALSVVGWLFLHALRLVWRVLALFGSHWAKKKLREHRERRHHVPGAQHLPDSIQRKVA